MMLELEVRMFMFYINRWFYIVFEAEFWLCVYWQVAADAWIIPHKNKFDCENLTLWKNMGLFCERQTILTDVFCFQAYTRNYM